MPDLAAAAAAVGPVAAEPAAVGGPGSSHTAH